jgi:hypothetical protein
MPNLNAMLGSGGQKVGKLTWDATGDHLFETGIDRVVLYTRTAPFGSNAEWLGVPWNGVTAIEDNPEGAEANEQYADNILYLNLISAEKWKGVVKAFTFPDEFYPCIGMVNPSATAKASKITDIPGVYAGQQTHKVFGMSYRTLIGNDTDGQDHGYKIHLVYNVTAAPSQQPHNTVNDSPEATEFSWDLSSVPMGSTYLERPTSTLVFDSTQVPSAKFSKLEEILYGTEPSSTTGSDPGTEPKLPSIDELIEALNGVAAG